MDVNVTILWFSFDNNPSWCTETVVLFVFGSTWLGWKFMSILLQLEKTGQLYIQVPPMHLEEMAKN